MHVVDGLFVSRSRRGGRGVFTAISRQKDELLCYTYSWELTPGDLAVIDTTSIEGYWFWHPMKIGWGLLPIGLSALVNCSITPNSVLEWMPSELGCIGVLRTLQEIEPNEELLIDYGIPLEPGWIS